MLADGESVRDPPGAELRLPGIISSDAWPLILSLLGSILPFPAAIVTPEREVRAKAIEAGARDYIPKSQGARTARRD